MRHCAAVIVALWSVLVLTAHAADRYAARGLVLEVDRPHLSFVASIDGIAGFMPAMSMPFYVRTANELNGLVPGAMIEFTLVVDKQASYAEGVRVRRVQNVEQDPLAARRLALLKQVAAGGSKALAVGDRVPDFRLIDQKSQPVSFAQLRGKVVAINFMYTACQLPDFCLRIVNHFGTLQKRFAADLGRDLVLLTITFDPLRDQPDVLDRYASQWHPNPATWHFLTGPAADVRRVLDLFGVSAFPDEGLMDHSLHTVVVDRSGAVAANIEGNQYSPEQLVDLVAVALKHTR